jgi:hypothetical protein
MTVALHHGDCREIVPTLGVTVDCRCLPTRRTT